jgi:hypothetical protein
MLDGAWDQINHEHVCYHSKESLTMCAERAGFHVEYCTKDPINGGSLRVHLRKAEPQPDSIVMMVDPRWDELGRKVSDSVDAIRKFCVGRSQPCVLGASQRGNTVLQAAGVKGCVRHAVERDERKVGRYTPGTMIPIIGESPLLDRPSTFRAKFADRYIVTPWQFKDEVLKREKEQGAPAGTQYLFPLPTPEIVTL